VGRDMYQRGTKYPASAGVWGLGLATAADSLAAIQKLVYEDKTITLEELASVLRSNFENHEALRQFLLNQMPKYGNDDDSADLLAKEIGELYCREMLKHKGPHGEFYLPLLASYMGHINAGETTGATPDGRRAGEPVSDAASPAQGRDIKGPTAVLKSATKIDYTLAAGGVALNIKFAANTLMGQKGLKNLRSFLKAYFQNGGQEIQVSVVSRDTLMDAKAHPEQHRNLVVRVAGFNEYFVKLDANLQDEIIARTEH
jgi:pyruvate-formate lyase